MSVLPSGARSRQSSCKQICVRGTFPPGFSSLYRSNELREVNAAFMGNALPPWTKLDRLHRMEEGGLASAGRAFYRSIQIHMCAFFGDRSSLISLDGLVSFARRSFPYCTVFWVASKHEDSRLDPIQCFRGVHSGSTTGGSRLKRSWPVGALRPLRSPAIAGSA